jgi:DNA-binding Lrp family transcriptional regulator
VRNRIRRLESNGVSRGYHADVDDEAAGDRPFAPVVRRAPIPEREELAAAAEVPGVVEVQAVMTGEANALVRAVGVDGDDLTRVGEELDGPGLRVSDEDQIRSTAARTPGSEGPRRGERGGDESPRVPTATARPLPTTRWRPVGAYSFPSSPRWSRTHRYAPNRTGERMATP